MAACTDAETNSNLQLHNQQKQVDQALTQLAFLEQVIKDLASRIEAEETRKNAVQQINDVDARVQSLAEQAITIRANPSIESQNRSEILGCEISRGRA